MRQQPSADLTSALRRIGLSAGLDAMGVTTAEPFAETRSVLEQRRAAGLAAGMQFTYRNPGRSTDPASALPGARSIVVGARRYLHQSPAEAPERSGPPDTGPWARVARFAWSDHYDALRGCLAPVADELLGRGHRAVVLVDDNRMVDRAAAHRAGLGWYGKNTNLLLPGAGSWYVLGSVVTDAELVADRPVAERCGSCDRCIPACPTGALVAPGVLDGRRCLAWLVQAPGIFPTEHRDAVGDRIYGCDDCQEVCPVNRLGVRRRAPSPAPADATDSVDVVALLRSSDDEILRRWGRWYISGRQPRWLRRNALLVLGNSGDGRDPDVVDVLRRALGDDDAVVRAHAVWAAARLGRHDLLAAVGAEEDPDVRAELAAATTVRPAPGAVP